MIIRKYTPRVRSETAPMAAATAADTPKAAAHAPQAEVKPASTSATTV